MSLAARQPPDPRESHRPAPKTAPTTPEQAEFDACGLIEGDHARVRAATVARRNVGHAEAVAAIYGQVQEGISTTVSMFANAGERCSRCKKRSSVLRPYNGRTPFCSTCLPGGSFVIEEPRDED